MFEAINALLSAKNLDDLRAQVQAHAAELLPQSADQWLASEISRQTDPNAVKALSFIRELLQLCRQHGIDETFRRIQAQSGGSPSQAQDQVIFKAVQEVLQSESGLPGLRASIEANEAVLMAQSADDFLARVIPQQDNQQVREALDSLRMLLQVCRAVGIDEAFRRLAENR